MKLLRSRLTALLISACLVGIQGPTRNSRLAIRLLSINSIVLFSATPSAGCSEAVALSDLVSP
jgi:hypothetical protein